MPILGVSTFYKSPAKGGFSGFSVGRPVSVMFSMLFLFCLTTGKKRGISKVGGTGGPSRGGWGNDEER
jgi:hypothetical protein